MLLSLESFIKCKMSLRNTIYNFSLKLIFMKHVFSVQFKIEGYLYHTYLSYSCKIKVSH